MLIAAYGTLRDGLHSAKHLTARYGPDAVKDLGSYRQHDYKLYGEWMPSHNLWCPFAVHTPGSTMMVSLLDIADGAAADDIDRGESWAYDKVVISAVNGPVYLYQSRSGPKHWWKEVPGGDYAIWAQGGFK